jgi:hypothetical protein
LSQLTRSDLADERKAKTLVREWIKKDKVENPSSQETLWLANILPEKDLNKFNVGISAREIVTSLYSSNYQAMSDKQFAVMVKQLLARDPTKEQILDFMVRPYDLATMIPLFKAALATMTSENELSRVMNRFWDYSPAMRIYLKERPETFAGLPTTPEFRRDFYLVYNIVLPVYSQPKAAIPAAPVMCLKLFSI